MYWQLKSRVFSSGRSPRTRTKWQGSVTRESFLKTISCSRKLSTAEYKISLNETYKTDLSEKRGFHNENLRWRTKWSHSTDEKTVTHWSQLLPSSWQCQCQLLPPNDLLESDAQSENVLTFHDENRTTRSTRLDACLQRHTHWCRSPYSQILRQKEGTSSFRISLSSTKISDVCN